MQAVEIAGKFDVQYRTLTLLGLGGMASVIALVDRTDCSVILVIGSLGFLLDYAARRVYRRFGSGVEQGEP